MKKNKKQKKQSNNLLIRKIMEQRKKKNGAYYIKCLGLVPFEIDNSIKFWLTLKLKFYFMVKR